MSDSLQPHGLCVAHQVPRSIGFSRQNYRSKLLFPPPGYAIIVCIFCMYVHARKVAQAVFDALQTYGLQLTRLLCPWDSPGKNTGVGCHAILQGILLCVYVL